MKPSSTVQAGAVKAGIYADCHHEGEAEPGMSCPPPPPEERHTASLQVMMELHSDKEKNPEAKMQFAAAYLT